MCDIELIVMWDYDNNIFVSKSANKKCDFTQYIWNNNVIIKMAEVLNAGGGAPPVAPLLIIKLLFQMYCLKSHFLLADLETKILLS